MVRCVAIVLFLVLPSVFSEATGNIGCLFSETLCNQETEWCYDDYAFGRCLPLYGNMREENMFRYNMGTGELHALEKEMQRLFQLGYRWSHTYTQCVLQVLLSAIQEKSEFDVSSCNVDLDQDLEGALKAIEGEEVEHIDPRNLAIVQFAPSAADPHSDYADEFYFPPVNEILPPYRPNEHDEQERNEKQGNHMPRKEEEKGSQSDNDMKTEYISRIIDPQTTSRNRVSDGDIGNKEGDVYFTPDLSLYLGGDRLMKPELDDYDDGYMPYVNEPIVMPLIQKRANILERRMKQYDAENSKNDFSKDIIFKQLLRRNPVSNKNLSQIAQIINNIRYGGHAGVGPREHVTGQPIYSPAESDRGGMYNYPDSRFRISEDSYYGRFPSSSFMNGPYKHEKSSGYVPYVTAYDRTLETPDTSQIPELIPPDENSVSYISDEIHPRYDPPVPSNLPEEQLPESNSISDVDKQNSIYENSVSRFDENGQPVNGDELLMETTDNSGGYKWPSKNNQKPNNNYKYNHHQDPKVGYNTGNQMGQPPYDYPLYYYNPYPQYFDYDYYDYSAYPNYMENMDQSGRKGWNEDFGKHNRDPFNLERSERFDEKKPGPPFMKLKEDSADGLTGIDPEPESLQGGGDWMRPMNKWMQEGLPYSFNPPSEAYYDETNLDSEGSVAGSDTLQHDEAILDGASDTSDNQDNDGQKEGLPLVAKHIGHDANKGQSFRGMPMEPEDSYIYITINGEFPGEQNARQLIEIILHYANIYNVKIEDLSVKKNLVVFRLQKMPHGISPAELAQRIENLRPKILKKTQLEITRVEIGTKTGLTSVVQQVNDRQMEAAAAIVCGVCGALLVSATALFLLRRHAKSKAKLRGMACHDTEASKDYQQDLCRARMAHKTDNKDSTGIHSHGQGTQVTTQRVSSLSKESENGINSPSSRSSTSSWSEEPVISNMDISTGHMVLSYMEDHLKNKDRLEQEWVELCSYEAEPCACNIALKGDNAKRNRYQDCVPYDHNRVILNEHTNINGSNYINASSITDHDPRNPAYIATQGPLTGTSADFWQLVWEQGSVVIVMLTRLTENGQSLCHRYWPEEGSELYHIYEVHLVSEHIWCDDYLVRSFYLKNVRTGETRTVTQFHFLSWPESGTPASTKALLEFRRKVNKSYRGRSCPIIAHCSDGVGRTGTYCLIDMVLNRMVKGSKEIDIAATLEHIRDQRPVMVKTKAQFEFVLMAVAEEVHAILKALPQ